jgi:hypothetical protein
MKADEVVDKGADKLETLASRAAAKGGVAAKVAGALAEDASFLRKLKPSLMVARAKGEAPRDQEPGSPPRAPRRPQFGSRSAAVKSERNPFAVAGAAFGLGMLLAKLIDWRSHAHPRR